MPKLSPKHRKAQTKLAKTATQGVNLPEALLPLWKEIQSAHKAQNTAKVEQLCQEALAQYPGQPMLLHILGMLYIQQARSAEALQCFNASTKGAPDFIDNYIQMGKIFCNNDQYDKAQVCYREAYRIDSKHPLAQRGMSNVAIATYQYKEAKRLLGDLQRSMPNNQLLQFERVNLSPPVWESTAAIDNWREQYTKRIQALPQVEINEQLPHFGYAKPQYHFNTIYHGRDNLELRKLYASKFTCAVPPAKPKPKDAPIRIGFFVDLQRENIFLKHIGKILSLWDANDMQPVVLCNPANLQKMQNQISNTSVEYQLLPDDFPSMVEKVRSAALDLLYYWEIGTTCNSYFLPFFKPAPIQVTGWGSVETSGISAMDYFISSEAQETEGSEARYSETLVKFKTLTSHFSPFPSHFYEAQTRADLSLSEQENLYFCAQVTRKLHPDMDTIFLQILEHDPHARILLVEHNLLHLQKLLEERLKRTLGKLFERITILPFLHLEAYCSLLNHTDVILDTFYYCGGQTTLDALFCGTPVITLPEATIRSRTSTACYQWMGITDELNPVASDPADYVKKAVHFATSKDAAMQLRRLTKERSHMLYTNKETVNEHLAFFREAVRQSRT